MKPRLLLVFTVLLIGALALAACGGGGGASAPAQAPAAKANPTSAPAAKEAAPAAGQQAAAAGNAQLGKAKFTQTCASCHGPEGKGVTGLGKDFTTSQFVKTNSDAQLVEFVKKGRPANDPANTTKVEMPPKGGNASLTDKDLADIVAYVRTLVK